MARKRRVTARCFWWDPGQLFHPPLSCLALVPSSARHPSTAQQRGFLGISSPFISNPGKTSLLLNGQVKEDGNGRCGNSDEGGFLQYMLFLQISKACAFSVLAGDCHPCPEQDPGPAARPAAALPAMGRGTCKPWPESSPRAPRPCGDGRDGCCARSVIPLASGCVLGKNVGFAELQPRVGSGSQGLFPAVLLHMRGFLLLCLFIPPPSKGGDPPRRGESLGRRKMRSSAGGWSAPCSPLLCCVIPGTFFAAVPPAHLCSDYNSSQPQT